ncbi:MAG: hypothetical protein IV093_19225 [Rubrivivax sp.]|nr:hypothetical protein [Rubrivivax sp.]
MKGIAELEIAKAAFTELAAQFPSLKMVREPNAPIEVSINLPVQHGLSHAVWLGLQNNDELHFSVGHFWLEWFPCTKPTKVREYIDAVAGYLSGRYRVVEHYVGARCVKAELQMPAGSRWQTVGTWSNLWALLPRKRASRVLRNDAQQGIQPDGPASGGSAG